MNGKGRVWEGGGRGTGREDGLVVVEWRVRRRHTTSAPETSARVSGTDGLFTHNIEQRVSNVHPLLPDLRDTAAVLLRALQSAGKRRRHRGKPALTSSEARADGWMLFADEQGVCGPARQRSPLRATRACLWTAVM